MASAGKSPPSYLWAQPRVRNVAAPMGLLYCWVQQEVCGTGPCTSVGSLALLRLERGGHSCNSVKRLSGPQRQLEESPGFVLLVIMQRGRDADAQTVLLFLMWKEFSSSDLLSVSKQACNVAHSGASALGPIAVAVLLVISLSSNFIEVILNYSVI